jgi:citrate synthase
MNKPLQIKVKSRKEQFAHKVVTRISEEIPSKGNPYIAERCFIRGYDQLELANKRSFSDVLFLLLRGELPAPEQSDLFNTIMVALCNPGPRHPGTRAAMNAGAGKTRSVHMLPIALSIMGGAHLGGEEVDASMRFILKKGRQEPQSVAENLLKRMPLPKESDFHVAPGFGQRFGDIDIMPDRIASLLLKLDGAGKALKWSSEFVGMLNKYGYGWLATGVAAATFVDLGFRPRAGAGLYQIISSPGVLAHGIEMLGKSMTALPFIDDEHYFIEGANVER